MKKNIFYLMLVSLMLLTFMNITNISAQVVIGENVVPHPGAALELRTNKGLLLPRVNLIQADAFLLSVEKVNEANGMIVYNTNPKHENGLSGTGVYTWNGSEWRKMDMNGRYIPVESISVSTENGNTQVKNGSSLQLTETITPGDADNHAVVWSVISLGGIGSIDSNGKFTAETLGNAKIRARAIGGTNVYRDVDIEVISAKGEGTLTGASGNSYLIYTFEESTGLGTWIVENLKEGNPKYKQYKSSTFNPQLGERGYYYNWKEANQFGCIDGFRLPTEEECHNLINYLLKFATEEEKDYWLRLSAQAGYYFGYYDVFQGWNNNMDCQWWTATEDKYMVINLRDGKTAIDVNGTVNGYPKDLRFPVRCIKDEK